MVDSDCCGGLLAVGLTPVVAIGPVVNVSRPVGDAELTVPV